MDKILALLVVLTGSLLLPTIRLGRLITFKRAPKEPGRQTIRDVKADHVPLAPSARAGGVDFRPLTVEEKKEFKNSFEVKRKPRIAASRAKLPSPSIVP